MCRVTLKFYSSFHIKAANMKTEIILLGLENNTSVKNGMPTFSLTEWFHDSYVSLNL